MDRAGRTLAGAAGSGPAIRFACCFTIVTPLDIGVRLLLPVIALWAVLASSLVPVVAGLRPAWRHGLTAALAVLLAAGAASTALSFPDSLAWTAPPFRPGYAVATNSNVDWGQGLYALQSWSRGGHLWVSYFGPRGVTAADIPGVRLLRARHLVRSPAG